MSRIILKGVAHTYAGKAQDGPWALNPLDLVWEDGRTYALLGPSGCGKTTMLNIISGLVKPTRGRVLFDDIDITDMPTSRRNIAQVFQFPVIYGAMTVYENLAFPLVCRKWPRERISRKVTEVAEVLDLGRELRQPARVLTAAEKQLISLGRGLVREDVTALLMDEPLTVIDPQFKFLLRRKLREIIERFRLTVVYVTHDQNEAMTFADEVVVMNEGRVIQRGSPEDLFEYPRTTYVGYFIGSPAMNLFRASTDGTALVLGGIRLRSGYEVTALPPGQLQIGMRPEYLELVSEPGENVLAATVTGIMDQGSVRVVAVRIAGEPAKLSIPRSSQLPSGDVLVRLPPDRIRIYVDGELAPVKP
ncbi:MAG TPA: ABC transporter ATP-binding protein [Candidatus Sulfomarinibacteraceae bacterium]|nr:ABC transporter ATP-binding protein [Candidatus Sulfomarinibacteraceae bacterium]